MGRVLKGISIYDKKLKSTEDYKALRASWYVTPKLGVAQFYNTKTGVLGAGTAIFV